MSKATHQVSIHALAARQVGSVLLPIFMGLCASFVACSPKPSPNAPPAIVASDPTIPALQPFPADDPELWVCQQSPAPVSDAEIQTWCAEHASRGKKHDLGLPPNLFDLKAKNAYDVALQRFLSDYAYKAELGWFGDPGWRLTGPFVGEFGDSDGHQDGSYGVHPAVRVYYSPEMVDWMCSGRRGEPADGAMIIKEMHSIDPSELGLDQTADCMRITKQPSGVDGPGWTVMVRSAEASHDGWYWVGVGPVDAHGDPTGNPPIFDSSAVTVPSEQFFGPAPVKRNHAWYPTGNNPEPNVVVPYNEYGAYCLNCHASANDASTYASFDNLLGGGALYRHFASAGSKRDLGESGTAHEQLTLSASKGDSSWPFSQPLPQAAAGFGQFYGDLAISSFDQALQLRLPAQTWDHVVAPSGEPMQFLTSDNCSGCHDATNSNASNANMLLIDGEETPINLSPYGEWAASPMGLAGRDPIFYSQLQSETNHLPKLTRCIENTCLHCHGVMGQRQLAIDTRKPDAECRDLFAVEPPPGVPFGEPFALEEVSRWQDASAPAKYGALARDGISCTVCHHVSEQSLGEENTFTGNFVTTEPSVLVGPYQDDTIVPKPMQHALGIAPKFGSQVSSSALCGSCHNILLPTYTNDGRRYRDPKTGLSATYEQSTDLEWQNSTFAKSGPEYRSCQDCHMPTHYRGRPITDFQIANIESSAFAPTSERLPNEDIKLTTRDRYSRHSLHGLNLFLNEMFQQFPLILGVRQIDYNTASAVQPSLLTSAQSMIEMARGETASVGLQHLDVASSGQLTAEVLVTNLTGHYLPSGVGFRRLFIELLVEDDAGRLLWASGRTNSLGVILDGTSDRPLPTEQGVNTRIYQPHHETITKGDQVQIYQELITDSEGFLTTSFLRRIHHVKDNRLRPKGFDRKFFESNPSPYIKQLAELHGRAAKDPFYTDPQLTGADRITYRIALSPEQAARVARIRVRLHSQSIPPFYLQERFADAKVGPANSREIQRLYYMTSHLNTGSKPDGSAPIEGWKLLVAEQCQNPAGQPCSPR